MKIEFENLVRRLSFLCHLIDIKVAWINPRQYNNLESLLALRVFLKYIESNDVFNEESNGTFLNI